MLHVFSTTVTHQGTGGSGLGQIGAWAKTANRNDEVFQSGRQDLSASNKKAHLQAHSADGRKNLIFKMSLRFSLPCLGTGRHCGVQSSALS